MCAKKLPPGIGNVAGARLTGPLAGANSVNCMRAPEKPTSSRTDTFVGVEKWFSAGSGAEREASVTVVAIVFCFYGEKINIDAEMDSSLDYTAVSNSVNYAGGYQSQVFGNNPLEQRRRLFDKIMVEHPGHIPVIVTGKDVVISKTKFLVPRDMSVGCFVAEVRRNCECIKSGEAIFCLTEMRSTLPPNAQTIEQVWRDNESDDGFLHFAVVRENVFGARPR